MVSRGFDVCIGLHLALTFPFFYLCLSRECMVRVLGVCFVVLFMPLHKFGYEGVS